MKKQFLALIGGVMVAGLAMAAEVVGNNEAVVIQKAKVESATGFQFLCVPVAPLNITNANSTETIPLKELLPPALYPVGTLVTPVVDGDTSSYQVGTRDDELIWKKFGETAETDVSFEKGTIFWLKTTKADATVFCGQSTEAVKVTDVTGIVPCGNTSSEAKTLDDLINEPTPGSLVYVIEADKTDYKTYQYDGNGKRWCTWNAYGLPIPFDGTIAAGEAFYYLKK